MFSMLRRYSRSRDHHRSSTSSTSSSVSSVSSPSSSRSPSIWSPSSSPSPSHSPSTKSSVSMAFVGAAISEANELGEEGQPIYAGNGVGNRHLVITTTATIATKPSDSDIQGKTLQQE
ncbi:hypothetical protein K457DRAFT_21230, partial [Linnemannia elongata AG-77]